MKYFFITLAFLILFTSSDCFAQEDDKNERVLIGFNFNNPDSGFKKKLPFDEPLRAFNQ